jgi:mRNA interferase HicA
MPLAGTAADQERPFVICVLGEIPGRILRPQLTSRRLRWTSAGCEKCAGLGLLTAHFCAIAPDDRRRVRKANQEIRSSARRAGVFRPGHGKGSHGRLYFGDRFTTLKDRRKEIGPGLLKAMLDQLGLARADLED